MLKQPVREPIHLASLRRRSKIEESAHLRQEQGKKSYAFDLQLFQESLNIHKEGPPEEFSWEEFSNEHMVNSKASAGNELGSRFLDEPRSWIDMKLNFNSALNESQRQANIPKNMLASQGSNYSNIHKTRTCLKPNTSKVQNKENNVAAGTQNPSKTRNINSICTLKSDVLREIKMLNQNQQQPSINQNEKETNASKLAQIYEKRFKQLQFKNEQACRKVSILEEKLKEKQEMASRLDKIEKDLNSLSQENKELLRMNQSLSKLSLHSEDHTTSDVQIQTEVFPLYVADSFCQTIPWQLQAPQWAPVQCESTYEMRNSTKNWKNELDCERINTLNRQVEFKAVLQNTHIEYRQQLDRLQKQYDALTINYEHKCQQVRDKDSLIAKYLFNKP